VLDHLIELLNGRNYVLQINLQLKKGARKTCVNLAPN
jgi:hypothetical protein